MDDLPEVTESFQFFLLAGWTIQNLDKVANFIDWATPKIRTAIQFVAPFMQPQYSREESGFAKLITKIVDIFVGVLVASFYAVLIAFAIVFFAVSALENGGGLSSVQLVSVLAYSLVLALLTRFYSVFARNALHEVRQIRKGYGN